jgi:SAM-dependent methyltransferase
MPTDVHDVVRKQFGAAAADYANTAVHISGPDLDALLEAGAFDGTESVLDLGCGAGHTTLAVARSARHVTGIDVTEEMLTEAKEQAARLRVANVEFLDGDACEVPFDDASFDAVTCRFAAHHFPDMERSVREAARVLRPGGKYLLVDSLAPEDPGLDTFVNMVEYLRDASHVRNLRASEWRRLFEAAGLEAQVVYRAGLALDGADWVKRMRTPPSRVAMIRELFETATSRQRAAFEIQDEPWGFSLPVGLITGVKRA